MSKEWLKRAYLARAVKNAGGDLALCVKNGAATHCATCATFDPSTRSLASPITTLLHNLRIGDSDGADVYSTAAPSEMCKGMARLYGVRYVYYKKPTANQLMRFTSDHKNPVLNTNGAFTPPATDASTELPVQVPGDLTRFTALKPFQRFAVPENVAILPMKNLLKNSARRDEFFMYLTLEIARRAFGAADFHEANRDAAHAGKNIAALLVDEHGSVISWGVNTNAREKWRHAEVNTLCSFVAAGNTGIPANATLYTTLEPCEMCAGLIAYLSGGANVRIIHAMADSTLGKTVLNDRPADNLGVARSTAKFFLHGTTNGVLQQATPVPRELSAQFELWKAGIGADRRMTEFFNTANFFRRTAVARQHWFEVLWRYLQAKFYHDHKEFCDASVGRVTEKRGWASVEIVKPERAQKIGLLASQSKYEAAKGAMAQLYSNLEYVLNTYDAFLRAVPGQLK